MNGEQMLEAFGHLSAQMLVHVLLMNAVAPMFAMAAGSLMKQHAGAPRSPLSGRSVLFPAMIVQLTVLWAWHAPPVLDAAMRSDALHLAMQASLLLCATWFWSAVLFGGDDNRWRAVLALLVTSKLFCLLGVLLLFAPRALYSAGQGQGMLHAGSVLADQQLAGLLMLIACPVTYLIAGVVIAARWLAHIAAADLPNARLQNARRAV